MHSFSAVLVKQCLETYQVVQDGFHSVSPNLLDFKAFGCCFKIGGQYICAITFNKMAWLTFSPCFAMNDGHGTGPLIMIFALYTVTKESGVWKSTITSPQHGTMWRILTYTHLLWRFQAYLLEGPEIMLQLLSLDEGEGFFWLYIPLSAFTIQNRSTLVTPRTKSCRQGKITRAFKIHY